MATTEPVLTGPRASSLVICERRAVYEAIGAPREESDRLARIFRRGRRLGRMIAEEIAETLAADGRSVEVERQIPWPIFDPIGVGHADVFIPDTGHIVEIVSTTQDGLPPHKARQAAFYAVHEPAAREASVFKIDPSSNEETVFPIDIDTFRPEIEESVDRVVNAISTEGKAINWTRLARRDDGSQVESPSEWPCFDCPFKRTCWANHEPEPVGVLPDDMVPLVAELADLEDRIARSRDLPMLEERRAEIRERLAGRMHPGANYRAPGFQKIRRTEVSGRRTFALKAFEDAGHRLPEIAQEFVKTGKGHDRWTIEREQNPR